ncbi:Cbs [Trypoxylus dichotomus]
MADFQLPNWQSRCTWHKGADPSTSPHTKRPLGPPKKIYSDALETIGRTPLIRLNKIPQSFGIKCEILVKCEYFNPGGSVKDRIAYRMVIDAEESGRIKPGDTIIEATSGNTGIGLALACAIRGYRCVIVMPEKMSNEKVDTLRALGAEIIRTPTTEGSYSSDGLIAVSQRIQKQIPNSVILDQYSNASNPLSHYDTTAVEIFDQCDGKVDMVVAGSGTGGTLTGIGRKMREIIPTCRIIGVDPEGSIMARPESINKEPGKFWEVEGIGYDFIPTTLDHDAIDEWVKISDKDGLGMAKRLIREEGLLCGGSAGANVAAAIKLAAKMKSGQRCVVILPDSIRNYLSKFVSDAWMEVRHLQPCKDCLNHWWWDHTVNKLDTDPPISITPKTSCQRTLNLLRKFGIAHIPVVASSGKVQGIATVTQIMNQFLANKVTSECPIQKAMVTKFIKVKLDTTLGVVTKAIEIDGFAVIVEEDQDKKEELIGLITPADLLEYTTLNPDSSRCTRRKCT